MLFRSQVTLHCKFATVPVPVHADRGMLDQVVMNLAVNARDAMNAAGELEITTSLVIVSEEQREQNPEARPGQFCRLSVRDTGCGMDAATQARIFEPFFTTKEVGKGTGLGLSISYEIINKHGGDIFVDSTVGKGTTFTVRLPCAPENAA